MFTQKIAKWLQGEETVNKDRICDAIKISKNGTVVIVYSLNCVTKSVQLFRNLRQLSHITQTSFGLSV